MLLFVNNIACVPTSDGQVFSKSDGQAQIFKETAPYITSVLGKVSISIASTNLPAPV
jgi:hypothetical protein